jgi:hypothetical protein
MTRTSPRPRRTVGSVTFIALRPVLRYSQWRDAYVLRGVGNRVGPVLRRDRHQQHPINEANEW